MNPYQQQHINSQTNKSLIYCKWRFNKRKITSSRIQDQTACAYVFHV